MATLRITYWRDIPTLVTARDGTGDVSVPLSAAFQELVDRVAMQEGLWESEAYLAEWRVGPEEEVPEPAAAAALARAALLEAGFEAIRARHLRRPDVPEPQ